MKRIVITLTLLIVTVSAFFILLNKPINTVKFPTLDKQKNVHEVKPPNKHLKSSNVTQVTDKTLSSKSLSNNLKEDPLVSLPAISDNPAAEFDNLPEKMQEEIKQLSGRNNKNIQPIEVEPGVFLIPAGKGVNVVPVAVINDDGTVSIHEY